MTDFHAQRINMVDSQVRPNGITDSRIITAMSEVPREMFLAGPLQAVAYADADLIVKPATSTAPARALMSPMALARLLQLAEIPQTGKVLLIGCATGYLCALLARLCQTVIAVEDDLDLLTEARRSMAGLNLANVTVYPGRHSAGRSADAPYDVILVSGRIGEAPAALTAQLKDHGRLVAAVGERNVARATVFTRHGASVSARGAFDITMAPLPGFEIRRPAFVF